MARRLSPSIVRSRLKFRRLGIRYQGALRDQTGRVVRLGKAARTKRLAKTQAIALTVSVPADNLYNPPGGDAEYQTGIRDGEQNRTFER